MRRVHIGARERDHRRPRGADARARRLWSCVSFGHDVPVALVVALASVALATDALDGRVARRTGTVEPRSAPASTWRPTPPCCWCSACTSPATSGLWVLAIGLARYVFLAAKVPLPWLRGQAPARPWCKVVAALQGIVLAVAASGCCPGRVAVAALLVALALLAESFAHEAWDLWRVRQPHRAAARGSTAADRACSRAWSSGPRWSRPTRSARSPPPPSPGSRSRAWSSSASCWSSRRGRRAWLATGARPRARRADPAQAARPRRLASAFARRFDPLGDPVYIGAGVASSATRWAPPTPTRSPPSRCC